MNATHFKNKSGYIVKANDAMRKFWKELELEPVYGHEDKPAAKKAVIEDAEIVGETLTAEALKGKTVTELKAMCKEKGITGYSKMLEDELITALMAE